MTGEKDLRSLLATMHPVRRDGEYVYVLWPHGKELAGGIAAAVREAEGLPAGESGIGLLGDPAYYARFLFVTAASRGVEPPDAAWDGYFQLVPLAAWPGGVSGTFSDAGPFPGR